MSTDYKFEGWAAFGPDSIKGNFKRHEYEPKPFEETDVDIAIQYCGICASDLHTASGGWAGPNQVYPEIVGHEIVGKAVRVGSKVTHVKVGDIVGVGAQCDSCGDCRECNMDKEPRCSENVGTYGGSWKKGVSAGVKSWGGYADYGRYPGAFVVQIPEGVDPAMAAPMLCGGGTVYNPLKSYGAGPGVDVGIVGIGGLGHFGLLFAKALGANVTAISHSERKKEDAEKMGATRFIATHSGGAEDFKPYARSLDLIICTTNDAKMPIDGYLSLLRPDGRMVLVGAPEEKLPQISAFTFIVGSVFLGGSMIASPKELNEMLALAKDQKVDAWIKKWDMEEVNKAVPDMEAGNARYRHVLVNTKNGGVL